MSFSYHISADKIRKVSLFRSVIAFVALIVLIYWQSKLEGIGEIQVFFGILIFIFGISIIYGLLLFFLNKFFLLAIGQILIDYLVISFIVAKTGGVDSPFIFFYVFPVLEAGIFFGKNGSYLTTFLNLGFLGLSFVLQFHKIFPYSEINRDYNKETFLYYYSIFSLGFLVLGLLIAYLNAETRKARESLKESEDKYLDLENLKTAIIQCIDSGLIIVTANDNIYAINDVAKKTLDKLRIKEKDFFDLFKREIKELYENRQNVKSEKRIKKTDKIFYIGASLVPLYDHKAEMAGVLINFTDITEKKSLEEKLRIEDKFAFLGKLSAVIAHEIKNPLASVKGSINFLKEVIESKEDVNKLLDISVKELDRLNDVINNFLLYSRTTPLQISNIYLKNLIDEIWFEISFSMEKKERYNYAYRGEDIVFRADPNQIRQVFLNLFLNSIDVLKEKGGGNIFVTAAKDKKEVIIEIEDDGGGIKEDLLNRVFDPFFTTKKTGTGLGLAIVYKIIDEHKGQIFVSNTEKGAKFTIRLGL